MKLIVYLAIGGMLGTLARYALGGLIQPSSGNFPWGTMIVNLAGAFLLGFLMRYLLWTTSVGPELRAALTIGFCGSFTTMSTFSYETVTLMTDGEYWRAGFYLAGSIGGTIFAVLAGMAGATRML
jgi:fluoride exporter